MIVLDASAGAELVLESPVGHAVGARLRGETLHGPGHFDVEVAGVIRRAVMRNVVDDRDGLIAFAALRELPMRRWPVALLIDRAYSLRITHTVADGLYVALGEALGATVLTVDERLVRSHGHHARVETP